jgi:hypothetical protein
VGVFSIWRVGPAAIDQRDLERAAAPPLPTVGLISETDRSKGSGLNKTVSDAVNDVVMGRKKVSDWDGSVKKYLSDGGDPVNKEYSEAYAKANG